MPYFQKLKLRSEKDFIAYKNGKRVYDVDLYISPSRWDNSNKNKYSVYVSHGNTGRVYSSEILGTPQLNYESTTNKLIYVWEGEYELKNGSKHKKISYTFKFLKPGIWSKIINQKSGSKSRSKRK